MAITSKNDDYQFRILANDLSKSHYFFLTWWVVSLRLHVHRRINDGENMLIKFTAFHSDSGEDDF